MIADAHLRVARPTDHMQEVVHFYTHGLGFQIIGSFQDHDGFNGVMLGHPGQQYHLEFTSQPGHLVGRAPTQDNLLVFYLPDLDEWQQAVDQMAAFGYYPVPSYNPYWDERGKTFEDQDGYRIVLQNASWAEKDEPVTGSRGLKKHSFDKGEQSGSLYQDTETAMQINGQQAVINQGDIFWVQLEEIAGMELGYAHPYVVIQDNIINHSRISTVVVCALTSNIKRAKAPGNVLLEVGEANLPKQSIVEVSKISLADKTQLGEYIGSLTEQRTNQVLAGIRFLQLLTEHSRTNEKSG